MKKIIHIIPQDGLGGVEQAARSLNLENINDLDIEVAFIAGQALSSNIKITTISESTKLNSIRFYINGFSYLLDSKPDVIICSLWRSNIIGITYTLYRRLLCCKPIKLITFVHSNRFTNIVDKIVTKTSALIADEVWFDSLASKKFFFDKKESPKAKLISFFIKTPLIKTYGELNNFVYWGRLSRVKRVDKAIKLFDKIQKYSPHSVFYIYGPNDGELENLRRLVNSLELKNKVFFMGPKAPGEYPKEILSSKFFISTSLNEGMGISVSEAMQLGLVPIVTPVGEIANYCSNNFNSIYFDASTSEKLKIVLEDNSSFNFLRKNAIACWKNRPTYSEDFISNCRRIIES